MAVCVAPYHEDRHATALREIHTRLTRTGLVDRYGLSRMIRHLADAWTEKRHGGGSTVGLDRLAVPRTWSRRVHTAGSHECALQQVSDVPTLDLIPPPTYEDSLLDCPPDYTGTDAHAIAQVTPETKLDLPDSCKASARRRPTQHAGYFGNDVKIDLTQPQGIRSHANKKAKKAAKAAQNAKWADDDDGEKKEEGDAGGDGGAGGGNDAGGAGGGDGGGDPPGGGEGGGDDDDFWGTAGGGKKKKDKKKKKNAWFV